MQTTLIDQGITLMLFGMGTVFVFLTVLVFATNLMSSLVNKFVPDSPDKGTLKVASSATYSTGVTDANSPPVNPKHITAIEHAVAAHRARTNK